jgi:hypothetical protein
MRRLFGGSLAALGLAILLAAPAAAGEPSDMRFFERGRIAFTFGGGCEDSADGRRVTCTHSDVQVFQGERGGTEPEFRFRGEEVCVFRSTETINKRTGRVISSTFEEGCARNRASLDVDFSTGLRRATVDGTIRVQGQRCDQESCEPVSRRLSIDLAWDGHGPVADRLIYFRETRGDCETVFSGTERERDAHVTGNIGNRTVSQPGALGRHDLQETRVCQ